MHLRELKRRGFRLNRNITGFTGFCAGCQGYALLDWWEAPGPRGGQVVVCGKCGTLDKRDESFVRSYPEKASAAPAADIACDARRGSAIHPGPVFTGADEATQGHNLRTPHVAKRASGRRRALTTRANAGAATDGQMSALGEQSWKTKAVLGTVGTAGEAD